jgi:glycosyltransferase involved in cell wall biosynthesis
MTRKRLAILTTHPIQYHGPWFRALGAHPDLDLEVLYCHKATPREQAAAGFGIEFDWDVSLLDGYRHRFLKNVASDPSVITFQGLDIPELNEIIATERFDALMINGWHYKSAWQAMRACWRNKTPVMVRSDSHLETERSIAKQVAKWPFYRWFIPKLDGCLAVGTWSRNYFLHYGARPDRVFIVPHVVDTDYFRRESVRLLPQCEDLRSRWGFDQGAVVFLFAGKFVEKKRPMDFVRAVGDAAKAGSPVAGLMVGDGPLRAICEEFAVSNSFPITFAGFLNQSEITEAYVAADALVLPSDGGETWGLVVNEAMACGLPCIVSDHVGCGPDMIVPNETGATFPLGDTGFLADLLISLGSRQSRLAEMGRLAGKKADAYSVKSAVGGVVKAVSEVCDHRR